ncbi:MAG: hypothetical protein ACT4PI_17815 [Actinomycetota bacterium]
MTATTTGFDRFRADVQARVLAGAPEQLQRLEWGADQIHGAQRNGLHKLLAHAADHSPLHQRRLAGIDLDRVDPTDMASLPVMTKADMMTALDDVFTDHRLTRGMVERALAATGAEPVPILDEYIALSSGGSSGQRGVFVFDRAAIAGFISSISRSLMARLDALGGPPPGGLPIAMIAAGSAVHATGTAPAFSVGHAMPFRFEPIPATLSLPDIVERLNTIQAPALYGYPSMLARLAVEQQAGRLHIAPMAVTSTSETLLPETRAAITEAFGAPVVDTFGSTEGLVGTSAPGDSVLVFNTDMCIVELVDDDNRPVPPGIPSTKVLVTNLYNLAQPLIRYELADAFARQPDAHDHGHLRARVNGRTDEVLHYEKVDVHPLVIRSVMVKSPEIIDYQVRQTRHGIDVDAITADTCGIEGLSARLGRALTQAGFDHPEVTVRIVDRLERHHDTGKLRRFVPLPAT